MLEYLKTLWNALDLVSMENTLLRVASVLLCLVVHEVCHGLAAYALGDPTAKRNHRLSLNPLHHIDWLGLAAMFFVGVGWARPVPVNPRYFKKPKRGMAVTAMAGPLSNFLLAYLALAALRISMSGAVHAEALNWFLGRTATLSIGLGLFNLLPIPPLDGSKVLAVFLPDRAYGWLMRYERFGMLLVLLLMSLGPTNKILSVAITRVVGIFCRLAGF